MTMVTIADANNRPDQNGIGGVPYVYELAKCQLTNAEWCEFLNAVGYGKAIVLKLYHKDMTSGILGGIGIEEGRESSSSSRKEFADSTVNLNLQPQPSFTSKPGWERKPVVYIRYVDVCRYCNWLSSGDTERGSYDMTQEVPHRLPGATYFIPSNSEWYKAAYWRDGRYVNYPTGDELPTLDQANFERGDDLSVGPPYYFADVDDFADSATPDGVVQMGGNAWEMLEDVSRNGAGRLQCHYRGGSFGYTETGLSRQNCDTAPYNGRCYVFGVRIARKLDGWQPMAMPVRYRMLLLIGRIIRRLRRGWNPRPTFG